MERILFASDLDNTLMFSYKHKQGDDLCVEYLNGKPQGYMTRNTPALLNEIKATALFIPITTRSIDQYKRIQWPCGCEPKYAVTSNGGNLLIDGEQDEEWMAETKELVAPWRTELKRMMKVLEKSGMCKACAIVDEMFLFAACITPDIALELQRCYVCDTELTVEITGRKAYFFSPGFTKGGALARLKQRFSANFCISAGDSAIDIPMLQTADIAICPESLSFTVGDTVCYTHDNQGRFSDFIVRKALFEIRRIQNRGGEG